MSHPGELISAWLDGELPDGEGDAVAAHVAACPACALEHDEVAAGRASLRAAIAIEPPDAVLVPRAAVHVGDGLSAWLDNELGAVEAAALMTHVDACPACAAELAEVAATRAAVRGLPHLEVPFPLRPAAGPSGRGSRSLASVGAAAAVLLGAAGLVTLAPAASADVPAVTDLVAAHDRSAAGAGRATQLSLGPPPVTRSSDAPASLAPGFQLVAVHRGPGNVMHARYEDTAGSALSLFRSSVTWPAGAPTARIDVAGYQGRHWATDLDQVVAWSAAGRSYAVVKSGPTDTASVVTAAASVPVGGAPSASARCRGAARRLVELIG